MSEEICEHCGELIEGERYYCSVCGNQICDLCSEKCRKCKAYFCDACYVEHKKKC